MRPIQLAVATNTWKVPEPDSRTSAASAGGSHQACRRSTRTRLRPLVSIQSW